MRKTISIFVLVCMTLHCLSRLQVISYLYAHRHELAYSVGIATEQTISSCQFDYFQISHLNQPKESDQHPSAVPQAHEITLGYPPSVFPCPELMVKTVERNAVAYFSGNYSSPTLEIFHPPLA